MKSEFDQLYRTAVKAMELLEVSNKRKPAMETSRLMQLNDLAHLARARCGDAMKALTNDEMTAAIEEFDSARRVEAAKAGLIGIKPMAMVVQ